MFSQFKRECEIKCLYSLAKKDIYYCIAEVSARTVTEEVSIRSCIIHNLWNAAVSLPTTMDSFYSFTHSYAGFLSKQSFLYSFWLFIHTQMLFYENSIQKVFAVLTSRQEKNYVFTCDDRVSLPSPMFDVRVFTVFSSVYMRWYSAGTNLVSRTFDMFTHKLTVYKLRKQMSGVRVRYRGRYIIQLFWLGQKQETHGHIEYWSKYIYNKLVIIHAKKSVQKYKYSLSDNYQLSRKHSIACGGLTNLFGEFVFV